MFNRATQAHRQPGSAFKPFVYLAALEAGISPWDTRDDEAVDINGYQPANFGGHYYGTLTLADALAHSVNTITVNLAQEVGIDNVVAAAKRLRHHLAAGSQCLAGAGHQRSDAAGIDRRLCRLRQWRLSRLRPIWSPKWTIPAASGLYQRAAAPTPQRVIDAASQPRHDGDAVWRGDRSGTGGGASLPGREAGGQDRHHPGFPRRLVRRLHHRLCRRGLGGQ